MYRYLRTQGDCDSHSSENNLCIVEDSELTEEGIANVADIFIFFYKHIVATWVEFEAGTLTPNCCSDRHVKLFNVKRNVTVKKLVWSL